MSEINPSKTFVEDGIRPVEKNHLDIADTFQDAGTRPIEKSPDYLVPENTHQEVVAEETIVVAPGERKVISEHPLVEIANFSQK